MMVFSKAISVFGILLLLGYSTNKTQTQADIYTKKNYPTLYVWPNKNGHSNNEATLSLVVKTGSLQEADDQLGLAHFVEHMAFNGTASFLKSNMQNRLNELGLMIGSHSNAFTTFDRTIYTIHLNDVTEERLNAALELLSQWAFHIEFSSEEIQLEKPVLLEELRLRESPTNNIQNKIFSAYYSNTRYSERKPIGTVDSISDANAQTLRAFYQKWYQPDNMAIIAAGDFNPKIIYNSFDTHFSHQAEETVNSSPSYKLDPASFPVYLLLVDEDTNQEQVLLKYIVEVPTTKSESTLIENIKWQGALEIWGDRASSRISKTDGDVIWVDYSWDYISPELLEITLAAGFRKGQQKLAIQLLESERIAILNGITPSELNDWRNSVLTHERLQQDSAEQLATDATDHFLEGWPMVGQKNWLSLLENRLPKFSTKEMSDSLKGLTNNQPNIWLIGHDSTVQPDHSELKNWLMEAEITLEENSLDPIEKTIDWSISSDMEGTIISTEQSAHQITTWTLGNGMTVHFKYSNQAPGKVYYSLVGKNGLNALSSEESIIARLALPAIGLSGLRNLDGTELQQWLGNHSITLTPYYNFFSRGISASSTSAEVDTLLNLLHVSLTEGSVSPKTWDSVKEQNENYLKAHLNSSSKNWLGIVDSALYLNDPALRTLELQELESITPNGIQNIYDTYFKGAQNYTLAIVGDVSLDKVRSEVLRAVATLAKSEHDSTPPSKTRNYPNPTSSVTLAVSGNGTQSASVVLRYSLSKTKAVQFTEVELALMASWVREELTLAIREKAGLTYNISAVLDGQTIFQDSYTLIISTNTDPANTKELIEEIDSTLTALLTIQPPVLKVQNWLDSMEADHKQALNAAEQQAAVISGAEIYGRKVAKSFEPLTVSNNFTPSFLTNALRGFLSKEAVRTQLTWLP